MPKRKSKKSKKSRKSRKPRKSRKSKKSTNSRKKSKFNSYFNHIFVINLFDRLDRWKKMDKQFSSRGIKIERFIAIDGRCKKATKESCEAKRKTFEMIYNVGIPNKHHEKVQDILPRSSITIGTLLILREMVKRKWKRILICEDDIILERDIEKKFAQGIKDIGNKRWDVLYLGCGGLCGSRDISENRTKNNKHITTWKDYYGDEYYTKHPNDLRNPCDAKTCVPISDHISKVPRPGGGWCYAYSLSGAKKAIKAIGNDASRHIDQLIPDQIEAGKMTALAFDPPIIWHENMRKGKYDSDNPWL